jgi:hypothetical protein
VLWWLQTASAPSARVPFTVRLPMQKPALFNLKAVKEKIDVLDRRLRQLKDFLLHRDDEEPRRAIAGREVPYGCDQHDNGSACDSALPFSFRRA